MTTTSHAPIPSTRGINPLFRIHLAGVVGSNLADGIVAAALPLLAVTLTRDPLLVSLVTGAFWLPWLLGALLVGVVVDRGDRARIRRLALVVRSAVMGLAAAAAMTGTISIWVLIALSVAYALTEVFSDLAADALVPQLVEPRDLPRANSHIMGAQRLMQEFVGAPIGGALVTIGSAWVFGVTGGLLALVALGLLRLDRPDGFRAARESSQPEAVATVRADVVHGVRSLWAHPVVRPLTIASALSNLVSTAYFAVFILWVVGPQSRVGLEAWQFPLLMTTFSAGALVGALVPHDVVRRLGEVRVVFGTWTLNGLLMLVPVIAPVWWVIAVVFALVGISNMVGNVISMSIRQRVVPAGLLGRIGGASRTLSFGSMALGAPLGGVVAGVLGLEAVFWTMPLLVVAVTVWVVTQVSQDTVDAADLALKG